MRVSRIVMRSAFWAMLILSGSIVGTPVAIAKDTPESGDKDAEDAAEQAEKAAREAEEDAADAAEDAARDARDAQDDADKQAEKDARDAQDDDADAAEQAARDAQDTQEDADKQAEKDARDAQDDVADAAEQAARDAQDAKEDADKQAEKDARDAQDDAADAAEQAARDAQDAKEDAEKLAEKDTRDAEDDAADAAEKTAKDARDAKEDTEEDQQKAARDEDKEAERSAETGSDSADQVSTTSDSDRASSAIGGDQGSRDAKGDDAATSGGRDDTGDAETASPSSTTGVSESSAEVAASREVETNDTARDTTVGGSGTAAGNSASTSDRDRAAPSPADEPIEHDGEGYAHAAHEILALVPGGEDPVLIQELGLSITSRENLDGLGMQLVRIAVPEGIAADQASARLAVADPNSAFAVNHFFAAGKLGGRPGARTPGRAKPSQNLIVGMIDGGVVPALLAADVVVESRTYSRPDGPGSDHGTAVASILANAGVGRIISADIFSGSKARADAIVRALNWMALRKVAVINMSFAGPPNPVIERMIRLLEARGHIIVAAIGNDGPAAPPLYPAAYPGVVAVTAVDRQGQVYRRANRGSWASFAAEGVDITTVDASGVPRVVSGTSFAAPIVSALLAREVATPDPERSRRALSRLAASARDLGIAGRDPIYGYGMVGEDR